MSFIRPGRSAVEAPAPPPPSGDITPSLVVEYVDTSGVRQTTTVVDGVTSISGVAPFLVHFDAAGSRSAVETTDSAAFFNLGYELAYGDAVSGTWPISGQVKTRDRGQPIWGWAYETAGTYTATLKVRDALDNQTSVTCQVVVTAPAAATNKPVSNGSWGTLVSGTHYSIDRGSDYTAWGSPPTDGLHGVLISATGSGADPIVASWSPDSRNDQGSAITRTANCRLLNIDVAGFTGGNVGYDFCGVVNGRCRLFDGPDVLFGFTEAVSFSRGTTVANNCRYPRGAFFFNCGEFGSRGNGYVFVDTVRSLHIIGCTLNKNVTNSGSHCFRGNYAYSSVRHSLLRNTVASVSFFKIGGLDCLISNDTDPWRSDDRAGDYSLGLAYGLPTTHVAIQFNQVGASGDTQPEANAGFGPENNNASPPATKQGAELSSYEDNDWFAATPGDVGSALDALESNGRALGTTNNKCNLGAGSEISYGTDTNPNRIPSGWVGPYPTGYTRPVPT